MDLKKNSILALTVVLVFAILSKGHSQSIRATIMHHNAKSSPLHDPNATEDEIRARDLEIARHRAKYFHNKKESTQGDTTLGVGPGKSALFIEFRIGTQRTPVHGTLDTGSSLTWVQCASCTRCFKQKGPMYDSRKSSSFKLLSLKDPMCDPYKLGTNSASRSTNADACNYTLSYLDQTFFSGVVGRETFTFKHGKEVKDLIFGCSTYNVDQDYNPPGLMGLDRVASSIIRQLNYPHFYYYVSYSERLSDMVGIIDMGTPPAVEPKNPIPLLSDSTFYYLGFESIYVSGKALKIPNNDFVNATIIDSGSAYTHLLQQPYETLTNAIIDAMGDPAMFSIDEGGLCYQNVENAPSVDFLFQNYKLRICPTNLWFKLDSGLYCLAIFNGTDSIIGMYQQRGMKVAYDLNKEHVSMSYISSQCPPFG